MIAGKASVGERLLRQNTTGGEEASASAEAYAARCREVLEMWLRWDEEQRQLTERMFAAGRNQHEIEQLLDECEVLRRAAAEATRAVLAMRPPKE